MVFTIDLELREGWVCKVVGLSQIEHMPLTTLVKANKSDEREEHPRGRITGNAWIQFGSPPMPQLTQG
jgi:hypothetical protein